MGIVLACLFCAQLHVQLLHRKSIVHQNLIAYHRLKTVFTQTVAPIYVNYDLPNTESLLSHLRITFECLWYGESDRSHVTQTADSHRRIASGQSWYGELTERNQTEPKHSQTTI